MLTLFFGLFSATILFTNFSARAERPVPPHEGRYHLGGDLSIYHSSANFTSNGTSKSLLNGATFDNQNFAAHGDFEGNEYWRVYSQITYGNTSASNGTTTTSNSGLNDLTAGGQWWLYTPAFFIIPQAQLTYPFWRVNESSNSALVGEGAMALELGSYAVWRLMPRLQPFGYIGLVYRDTGRSSLLPYAIGINWRPNRWWFEASIKGFRSLTHDSGSDTSGQHDSYLTRADGGSYRFDAQAPSLNDFVIETGWRFAEAWHVYAAGSMSFFGSSAANGMTGRIGLTYSGHLAQHASISRDDVDPARKFSPSTEKYDESLFQEPRKVTPPPVAKPKPTPVKKPRKDPSVDKLMRETEKELLGP